MATKKQRELQAKLDTLRKYGVTSASSIVEQTITDVDYNANELRAIAEGRGKTEKEFLALINEEVDAALKGQEETPIVPESEPQLATTESTSNVASKEPTPEALKAEEDARNVALADEAKAAEESTAPAPVEEEAQPSDPILEKPATAPKKPNTKK